MGVRSGQLGCELPARLLPHWKEGAQDRTPGTKPSRMNRVYEIFEVLPIGPPQRVTVVSGLEYAKARLHELATKTANECFASDARTHQIVALINVPPSKWRASKHIFQISYDERTGVQRAELLKSSGHSVILAIGNAAAKLALTPIQPYELFIVGHEAPAETRQEMVYWLKAKYPRAILVALNPPNQRLLQADYNAQQDYPEAWLPVISRELANSADSVEHKAATGH